MRKNDLNALRTFFLESGEKISVFTGYVWTEAKSPINHECVDWAGKKLKVEYPKTKIKVSASLENVLHIASQWTNQLKSNYIDTYAVSGRLSVWKRVKAKSYGTTLLPHCVFREWRYFFVYNT